MTEEQAPGVRFSLAVVEPILHLRTPHQELDLARTHALGQVLTLDGRIMVTERDEAFYHEMLVHPALLVHDRPERVLVVGGGDGGALRAVLSHPPVREVTLVDRRGRGRLLPSPSRGRSRGRVRRSACADRDLAR